MGKLISYKIEFSHIHDEVGPVYKVQCPECKDWVYWSEYGWGESKCSCGLNWRIEIIGIGW